MGFEEKYFQTFEYSQKERLIKRYIREVLKWGSKASNSNLLNGHGKTALDVGCAYGYSVEVLESLGYKAYGIDISKHGIRHAKKKYAAEFLICDVQEGLPFKSQVFDLVTCFEVLEHLSDPLKAMLNMANSCKRLIVCTTPNRNVEKPVKKIVREFDKTHIALKTPSEWEKIIRENLSCHFVKVETFFDASLRVIDKLLFFKSFKVPYFGLDIRILIQKGWR